MTIKKQPKKPPTDYNWLIIKHKCLNRQQITCATHPNRNSTDRKDICLIDNDLCLKEKCPKMRKYREKHNDKK